MRTTSMLWLTLAIFVALSAVTYGYKVVTVVPVLVPVILWTIPFDANDAAQFCVQTMLGPDVDPADAWPLKCVSVGAVRHWIRAQRLANE